VQAGPKTVPSSEAWRLIRASRTPSERPHHIANRILRQAGVLFPPIPIHEIVSQLGLQVIYAPKVAGWAGAVDMTLYSPPIWLESAHLPQCERLTLAHELGHVILHPFGRVITCRAPHVVAGSDTEGTPEEREAEEFALSMLVPLWLLEPMADSPSRRSRLANTFDVHEYAIQAQLRKLI
jgi:IrrE N-terminal-like domain